MAAELLAVLVPSVRGDAKKIALSKVEFMKDRVLRHEPALLVQLNRAAGDKLAVKAGKVCLLLRVVCECTVCCICGFVFFFFVAKITPTGVSSDNMIALHLFQCRKLNEW